MTCIAIMLARRDLGNTLHDLKACLAREVPCLDFDELYDGRGESQPSRCATALVVVLHGHNCTRRMTTATTRHLLDTIAHAMTLPATQRLNKAEYVYWRHQTMVLCVRASPRTETAIVQTLGTIAASLDGHPLIDTLHFEDHEGDVLVWCSLYSDADSQRYGLQTTDDIVYSEEATCVHVTRKGRGYAIKLSPRPPSATTGRVTDMCEVPGVPDGFSFPNAPTLSFDVASRFDEILWTCHFDC